MRVDHPGGCALTRRMTASKRWPRAGALFIAALVAGCSTPKKEPVYMDLPAPSNPPVAQQPAEVLPAPTGQPAAQEAPVADSNAKPELIVTPDNMLTGSVVSVNEVGRFVVLRFPPGRLPAEGSTLYAYREGLKVAELKVTGPQKDDHTVADIRSGACQPKDEVRDR